MKPSLFTYSLLFILSLNLYAQQPIITSSVQVNSLVCPGALTDYTLSMPSGYSFCSATWSIQNGVGAFFNNISTGSNVKITWSEQKPNKVTLQVTVKFRLSQGGSCTTPEETVLPFTQVLRTVFQESFTNYDNSVNIPYCASQPIVNLSVNSMYIKNTGGIGEPPLAEVERYQWIIPAGWKQLGTTNTGTIYTTISAIQLEPTNPGSNCSASGEVKIRGIAGGATHCVGLPLSISNQATIALSRTPEFTLTPPSGYVGQQCGNQNPVVFTATSLSCASIYNWTYPTGWSGPAQTSTNSVSVTPADTGGNVTVTINTGTCIISKSYSVSYSNPDLSNPVFTSNSTRLICSQGSGTASVNAILGAANYTWYTAGGTVFINGVSASSSNPVITTTPNVTISAPQINGAGYKIILYVKAGRLSANCAGSNTVTREIWLGKPVNVGTIALGLISPPPFYVCPNTTYQFNAFDFTNLTIVTTYSWTTYNNHTIVSYNGIGNITANINTGNNVNGTYISVRPQNTCGTASSWTDALLYEQSFGCSGGGCGFECSFSISPNPTSDFIELVYHEEEQVEYQYSLYDSNGTQLLKRQTKNTKHRIDIGELKSGLYILKIVTEKESFERRLKID